MSIEESEIEKLRKEVASLKAQVEDLRTRCVLKPMPELSVTTTHPPESVVTTATTEPTTEETEEATEEEVEEPESTESTESEAETTPSHTE